MPSASIIMFADEPYPLYNRIALPPMLRKQVPEAKVIIRDVAWHEKHTIDLRLSTRVDAINHEGKTVVAGGKEYPYDALLVATGGRPNPSEFPGAAGAKNIYNFQYMDDTKAISESLETAKTRGLGRRFVHRLRTRRSVRLARRRDALADPRTALLAPHARRDLGRIARRSGARRRLHDPLQR